MPDARAALEAIGQLPDAEVDVADAALQLGRIDAPEADWQSARHLLSELARDVVTAAGRMADQGPAGDGLAARAALLADIVAGRHGYHGAAEDYDDLRNANLIQVCARRRGLPVALGIIWLHAARAAGWTAHGVDFPGHFLVALAAGGEQVMIDVFDGGTTLAAQQLRALLRSFEGPRAELRPGLLQPMPNRAVLLRLQQNIKLRRLRAGDLPGGLACTEDMLRIAPEEASQWREAAVMHQRLDQVGAALRCYGRFIALVPSGEAADRVRATMDELRSRLN